MPKADVVGYHGLEDGQKGMDSLAGGVSAWEVGLCFYVESMNLLLLRLLLLRLLLLLLLLLRLLRLLLLRSTTPLLPSLSIVGTHSLTHFASDLIMMMKPPYGVNSGRRQADSNLASSYSTYYGISPHSPRCGAAGTWTVNLIVRGKTGLALPDGEGDLLVLIRSFIHSFIHSFVHSFIHSIKFSILTRTHHLLFSSLLFSSRHHSFSLFLFDDNYQYL